MGVVGHEMKSNCCTMVMVRVSVHPAGLGPREAGKAWYSSYFITHAAPDRHIRLHFSIVGAHYETEST